MLLLKRLKKSTICIKRYVYEARKSTFTKRVSIVVRRTIGSKFSKYREKKRFLGLTFKNIKGEN